MAEQVQMKVLNQAGKAHWKSLAIAAGALLMTALPSVAQADGQLRIVAPVTVSASEPVHFSADTNRHPQKMTFFVDGKPRWVDHSPSWRFGRDGYVKLAPGHHVLKVRAIQSGLAVTTVRSTYVEPGGSGSVGLGEAGAVASPASHAEASNAGSGELLFSGSKISDFRENQSAPGAVTEVPDPAGSGEKVLKMTVSNEDVAPITPTHDPRAQLLTPSFMHPGDEVWWHARFYLPKDFPSSVPGWLSLMEGPYGPPFNGSPPFSISVGDGEIRFQRNEEYSADIPWQEPIVRGQWVDVLAHIGFGTAGSVELWINGQKVNFFEPGGFNPLDEPETSRLEYKTMDQSNDGGANFFVLQNYREHNMFASTTVYDGPTEIGTSKASVLG
jgi:hypothetical protein